MPGADATVRSSLAALSSRSSPIAHLNYDREHLARIPEAPVFRPTPEEFKDPMEYIRSIWAAGSAAGICKIVPPSSWYSSVGSSQFPENMKFRTRQQEVNKLRYRHRGVADRFSAFVEHWHRAQPPGTRPAPRFPPAVRCRVKTRSQTSDHEAHVDLYQLYMMVLRLGGLQRVESLDAWPTIVSALCLPETDKNVCSMIEDIFLFYLLPLPRQIVKQYFADLPDSKLPPCILALSSASSSTDGNDASSVTNNGDGDFAAVCARPIPVFCSACDKSLGPDPENGNAESTTSCCLCGSSYHTKCFPEQGQVYRSGDVVNQLAICSGNCGFGFATAKKRIRLREYRAQSNDLKLRWLKQMGEKKQMASGIRDPHVSWEDIEREYWSIVEDPVRSISVQYGSDLDTKATGSGFPTPANSKEGVDLNPWNLNIFPSISGSLLKYSENSIKGINVPWLYCGSMFSTFCYHAEDLNMMSINYMHVADEGGGKVWYGAPPGEGALEFEAAIRTAAPELFVAQPDLLFQLLTMVSPVELRARGARVCRAVQRPGEFILTFPQGFHGGFSLGFNMAEAVNFFMPECLPWMRAALYRCHLFRKEPVFCVAKFIMTVVSKIGLHAEFGHTDVNCVLDEALKFVELEGVSRKGVTAKLKNHCVVINRKSMASDYRDRQSAQCSYCRHSCFFSGIVRTSDGLMRCAYCIIERDDWMQNLPARKRGPGGLDTAPFHLLQFVCLTGVSTALSEGQRISMSLFWKNAQKRGSL